ncbi:MAG: dipeptidase [Ktedonobacterales bacterium]|nr:dipeptidase [Ktedonobacterales bacterium]
MTAVHDDITMHIEGRHAAILEDFQALLRIPSISALPTHDADTLRAADYVLGMLRKANLEHVQRIETDGKPLLYADWLHAPGRPTVLLYAHYDVQPVDPRSEWNSDPFAPVIEDDYIIARGACDDKNNLTAIIHATAALLAEGTLPVNVRFLIEGEEESSGEAIEAYVRAHAQELASDIVLIADGGIAGHDQPQLEYGCRGMVYVELIARGSQRDLHSGTYGGNAPNPLFALATIIAGLKKPDGTITIPGLMKTVRPPSEAEWANWRKQIPRFEADMAADMGTPLVGDPVQSPIMRAWAQPTLEVHGFVGGFQDDGSKTVIPAEAKVKLSLRLVPDQDPAQVLKLLQKRVAKLTPPGITTEIVNLGMGMPFFTDPTSPAFKASVQALGAEFEKEVWLARAGGSVPIATTLQTVLGADTVMVGFGLENDGAHGPNEHTHLPTFFRGVRSFARMLRAFGEIPGAH